MRIRLILIVLVLTSGCATRNFTLVGDGVEMEKATSFYVIQNDLTEVIAYNYSELFPVLPLPLMNLRLDYEKYTKDRVKGNVKLDVPTEIVKYLGIRGKNVAMGPPNQMPQTDAIVISYEELWGWDMGDIIKMLKIHAFPIGKPEKKVSVEFTEMKFVNSHPVASSLVPQMLDKLFESDSKKR